MTHIPRDIYLRPKIARPATCLAFQNESRPRYFSLPCVYVFPRFSTGILISSVAPPPFDRDASVARPRPASFWRRRNRVFVPHPSPGSRRIIILTGVPRRSKGWEASFRGVSCNVDGRLTMFLLDEVVLFFFSLSCRLDILQMLGC